ncbi:MAG: DUF2917 domain-containing protein [Burkholderiales bacterium]|nr:DUF2917 domain-containing protein [Burkholderiales bacterium]
MSNKFANPSYTIAAGTAISGIADRARAIEVACGRVWLTIQGDLNDYWLQAGETFHLPAGRLVVIEADRQASLIEFAPARPAMRDATALRLQAA